MLSNCVIKFMNTSNAKHIVACDECGASIGELYPNNHNNISINLTKISKTNKGDSQTKVNNADVQDFASTAPHHFCDESCMTAHLNKRAKIKAKILKMSKASIIENGVITLDMSAKKI